MKFIDVHMHLESERFDDDRDRIVNRAKEKGATSIITSGTSPENNRKALAFSKEYELVRASFGMYPVGNFDVDLDTEMRWIEEHKNQCVAIGEIGLDYNEGRDTEEKQKKLFKTMLQLAKELGKTVVIHSRKAESDCLDTLEEENMEKVVMHCFGGKKALIRRGGGARIFF